jgi:polyhydroxybutyrate depolymerase
MTHALLTLTLFLPAQTEKLPSGRHTRTLTWDGEERSYHIHIPENYNAAKPAPVILALHGASMNGRIMEGFCGLSRKADETGFIVVYPNGTGPVGLLVWNSGSFPATLSKRKVDDIGFLKKVLDDLETVVNVDRKRIYCAGLSNGGMMAYRVAAEMSERVAAVASVAGTMVCDECKPKRPVSVVHFHGTKDTLVPLAGADSKFVKLPAVEETIQKWIKVDGCSARPEVAVLPAAKDDFKVTRTAYNSGKQGAEVVLYIVEGAGHIWPGQPSPGGFLGATTYNINANDLIWEFFQKHPLP